MTSFEIKDMSCNHCVGTITKAVKAVDPEAQLKFDLSTHRVEIESATADAQLLRERISDAGFTPVPA